MKMHTRVFYLVSTIITNVLLTAAFVLGIGSIALVLKIFKRALLPSERSRTTWAAPSGSLKAARMY